MPKTKDEHVLKFELPLPMPSKKNSYVSYQINGRTIVTTKKQWKDYAQLAIAILIRQLRDQITTEEWKFKRHKRIDIRWFAHYPNDRIADYDNISGGLNDILQEKKQKLDGEAFTKFLRKAATGAGIVANDKQFLQGGFHIHGRKADCPGGYITVFLTPILTPELPCPRH